jgi:RNA polymerase sigma factor (sigma-70 family)
MQPSIEQSADELFNTVYKKYRPHFTQYAYYILGDEEEANDILHDTFVKAWEARTTFLSADMMKAYVRVCSRNACFDRLKSIKRHRRNRQEVWQRYYMYGITETTAVCKDSRDAAVMRVIKSLDRKYQKCILMFYFEKMTCAKIAKQLNIKERNVRYFLHEGRVLIKMAMNLN